MRVIDGGLNVKKDERSEVNHEVVKELEWLLAAARRGDVTGVAALVNCRRTFQFYSGGDWNPMEALYCFEIWKNRRVDERSY